MLKPFVTLVAAFLLVTGLVAQQGTVIKSQLNTRPGPSLREKTSCALPDGSREPLGAEISYEGEAYRCVEVFSPTPPPLVPPGRNQGLTANAAGWIKAQTN
jgi:hypothetical protein